MKEEDDEFLEVVEEDDVGEDAEINEDLTDAERAGYTLLKEDDDEEDLKSNKDEESEDGLLFFFVFYTAFKLVPLFLQKLNQLKLFKVAKRKRTKRNRLLEQGWIVPMHL